MKFPKIDLQNYYYELPEEFIAQEPSENRIDSRLLVYRRSEIDHSKFSKLPEYLQKDDLLVLNATKVVNARLFFKRATGARIEVLLINPILPSHDPFITLQTQNSCVWKCIVGNKKKWREDEILNLKEGAIQLSVTWDNKELDKVKFEWTGEENFGQIVSLFGKIPLPPYLQKDPDEKDKQRYQTVYARSPGAVAAPTAGLHFNEKILQDIRDKGVRSAELVLHVGGGTFAPIKSDDPADHDMHHEYFEVSRDFIKNLIHHLDNRIIPVGTTSLRVLESLYWIGALGPELGFDLNIHAHLPYEYSNIRTSPKKALENLISHMAENDLDVFTSETGIFIVPGFEFRYCRGLITNFHLPGTTLILLVAALVGDDWKKIYESAKTEGYRFLSYGDSSLLLT